MKKVLLVLAILFICGCEEQGQGSAGEVLGFLDSPHTVDLKEPLTGDLGGKTITDDRTIIYYHNVSLLEVKDYIDSIKDKFPTNQSVIDNYDSANLYKFTAESDSFYLILMLENYTFTIDVRYKL